LIRPLANGAVSVFENNFCLPVGVRLVVLRRAGTQVPRACPSVGAAAARMSKVRSPRRTPR